jgi:Flp pilus assembly pilin Flp
VILLINSVTEDGGGFIMSPMLRFINEEKGQGLTEYALVLASIVIVVVAVLGVLGPEISTNINEILNAL